MRAWFFICMGILKHVLNKSVLVTQWSVALKSHFYSTICLSGFSEDLVSLINCQKQENSLLQLSFLFELDFLWARERLPSAEISVRIKDRAVSDNRTSSASSVCQVTFLVTVYAQKHRLERAFKKIFFISFPLSILEYFYLLLNKSSWIWGLLYKSSVPSSHRIHPSC